MLQLSEGKVVKSFSSKRCLIKGGADPIERLVSEYIHETLIEPKPTIQLPHLRLGHSTGRRLSVSHLLETGFPTIHANLSLDFVPTTNVGEKIN